MERNHLINRVRILRRDGLKNLSSKELSELERKGLEHGLKFAVVHNRIPTAEIIASVEEGIFPLDDDAKRLVRAEVSSILRRAKLCLATVGIVGYYNNVEIAIF